MRNKDKYMAHALWMACVGFGLMCGNVNAEEKSLWQKISDFFSPMETVEGEGPMFDQLRDLDAEIGRTEGKYSRERRRANKARYQKQLDSLQVIRDSLVVEIKRLQAADSVAKLQNAAVPKSSATIKSSSSILAEVSSGATSSAAAVSLTANGMTSSATAAVESPMTPITSSESAANVACARDTVYIRDTVYVHDTLYVMLANKPQQQDSGTAKDSLSKKSTMKKK